MSSLPSTASGGVAKEGTPLVSPSTTTNAPSNAPGTANATNATNATPTTSTQKHVRRGGQEGPVAQTPGHTTGSPFASVGGEETRVPTSPSGGEIPTDEAVRSALTAMIAKCDLATLTPRVLRSSLEAKFGVSLKSKKCFIKKTILEVVQEKGEAAAGVEEDVEGVSVATTGTTSKKDDAYEEGKSNDKEKPRRAGWFGEILSAELAEFLGMARCPRQTVVKKLWAYIKEHKLQDPKDGRKILLDEALAKLFGENGRRKSVNMLTMNKLLSKHVWVDDGRDDQIGTKKAVVKKKRKVKDVNNVKKEDGGEQVAGGSEGGAAKKKKPASASDSPAVNGTTEAGKTKSEGKKKGMMQKELELSEDLQKLVGAPRLTRAEVTKRFWQYIKEHELLDPKDKRFVLSDKLLEALTGKKRFKAFGFQKLFSRHMWEEGEVY